MFAFVLKKIIGDIKGESRKRFDLASTVRTP